MELTDELGTYIKQDSKMLSELGWTEFIRQKRGQSDLASGVGQLPHPANQLLSHLRRRGANVVLETPPWTPAEQDAAVTRGPHKSCHEYAEFLRSELLDFVKKGYWVVLPYKKLRNQREQVKLLRVSPMGVVPQRERRPRLIVDYSFSNLNQETIKLAPQEAMQFGRALQRLLESIVAADPMYGPVKMAKVDISDGFYRIWLNLQHIPRLAVSIPSLEGEEPLLALPLVLPMGWTESPPYFCAATETVTDIANQRILKHWNPAPHRLDDLAASKGDQDPTSEKPLHPSLPATALPPHPPATKLNKRPLGEFDVFVDDFLGLAQGSEQRLRRLRRILFHTLDEVMRPLESSDRPERQEPASVKKLKKGDADWTTQKILLGWLIDTLAMTISLPSHRQARLQEILDSIPATQKRLSVKKWHKVLGELRSMTVAIPGSRGMFSLLQEALRNVTCNRIRLSKGVHHCLEDFRWLSADLAARPTRLYEIIEQDTPILIGAGDSSGQGTGGVWFPSGPIQERARTVASIDSQPFQPILWRARFPPDIVKSLVSFKNPSGTITNSDLELAGNVLHNDIASSNFDVRERTITSASDNIATVSWQRKGSTTTTSAPAYLLRVQALHQRYHRYLASTFYLPGPLNIMADDCSRLWELSDVELLTHFNATYPQATSWRIVHPSSAMLSSVTSALRSERPEPASFLLEPPPLTTPGSSGPHSVTTCESTRGSAQWKTLLASYKSSANGTAPAKLLPIATLSDLAPWRVPSERSARRFPAWGPAIHASPPLAKRNSASAVS